MSVTVIIRFPVSDVAKAVEVLNAHADLLERITASTKPHCLGHRFLSGDGELAVIDEWVDAATFQSFFVENAEAGHLMAELGMTGEPSVSIYEDTNAPGSF